MRKGGIGEHALTFDYFWVAIHGNLTEFDLDDSRGNSCSREPEVAQIVNIVKSSLEICTEGSAGHSSSHSWKNSNNLG